jgi:hypothetical protein
LNINSTVIGVVDELSDYVGLKSGLGVTAADVVSLLDQDLESSDDSRWWYSPREWLHVAPEQWVRIRAEDLESLVNRLLYSVGALSSPLNQIGLLRQFATEHPTLVESIPPSADEEEFPLPVTRWMRFYWFIGSVVDVEGLPTELAELVRDYRKRSIVDLMFRTQRMNWDGVLPLQELFQLKDLRKGTTDSVDSLELIDQRFIDYLHAQPGDLSNIHWRQFEYLVGEFFRRSGYDVQVTAPSGDGGIDVRAVRDDGVAGPELVLIQAKRYSDDRPVHIETVKALWSDVDEHSATRGVIATTSTLAPGARAFCQARLYRLTSAERPMIEKWLTDLATYPRR